MYVLVEKDCLEVRMGQIPYGEMFVVDSHLVENGCKNLPYEKVLIDGASSPYGWFFISTISEKDAADILKSGKGALLN